MKMKIEKRIASYFHEDFFSIQRSERTERIKKLFASIFQETDYAIYANKMGSDKWNYITDD
jgi:hypothetical protein